MTLNEKALLPAGFQDLLPPQAGQRMQLLSQLRAFFESSGYATVNPPMVEFETTLLEGAGKALEHETFRLMDPVSRRMLGIRADMTVQVARIATTLLGARPRPLRLCYTGQVVRVKGASPFGERQLTQAGVELIGADSVEADVEAARLACEALKEVGVKGISIDFTLPQLPRLLLEQAKFKKETYNTLEQALAKKDTRTLREQGGKLADTLVALSTPGITAETLQALNLPKDAKALVTRLSAVIQQLSVQLGKEIAITVDPAECHKFGYHSGIGFALFSSKAKSELGRGGRYRIGSKGKEEEAVGFSLYVHELLGLLPEPKRKNRVYLPFGTKEEEGRALRAKGDITVAALSKDKDAKAAAKRQHCTHLWVKGKKQSIEE